MEHSTVTKMGLLLSIVLSLFLITAGISSNNAYASASNTYSLNGTQLAGMHGGGYYGGNGYHRGYRGGYGYGGYRYGYRGGYYGAGLAPSYRRCGTRCWTNQWGYRHCGRRCW